MTKESDKFVHKALVADAISIARKQHPRGAAAVLADEVERLQADAHSSVIADLRRDCSNLSETNRQHIKRIAAMSDRINALEKQRTTAFAVFGFPLTHPGRSELLAVYSSAPNAEAFVAAQDAEVQANIGIVEFVLDQHPSDDFWVTP